MTKKNETANAVIETPEIETIIDPTIPETPEQEEQDDAEIEEQIAKPASVVKSAYKRRYKDRAREAGHRGKAAKRSCWDWFAQTMAQEVLNKQGKIDIDKLVAILQANGEDDPLDRWPNRSKGWEGRLRMTGGLWLRTVVAEAGVMLLPDGEELVPPADWVKTILKL